MLAALVMSSNAPTLNSHSHTDRWPFQQAKSMGVSPLLFSLLMSSVAPILNNHSHTDRWPFKQE